MDKTPLASAALPLDAIVFPSVEEEAEPVRAAANDSGSDRLASDQVHRAVNEAVALYLLGASGIFFFFFSIHLQFIYNPVQFGAGFRRWPRLECSVQFHQIAGRGHQLRSLATDYLT